MLPIVKYDTVMWIGNVYELSYCRCLAMAQYSLNLLNMLHIIPVWFQLYMVICIVDEGNPGPYDVLRITHKLM